MTNDELRAMRFAGLDLSPNHYGLITLNGLGELVISHDDEIKERFGTVWTVTKDGGSAVLEVE